MNITTIIGLLSGVAFIYIGIVLNGEIRSFYDIASIMITLGGSIAATFVNYPLSQLARVPKMILKAFKNEKYDFQEGMDMILEFALTARREGLLSLEETAENMKDRFLKKGIMLVVDGTNPELVKSVMETELNAIEERHKSGQAIFESLAGFAPAFGMIGTLIGLINMLKKLDDPSTLGPSMAVALVTTFYGTVLANLVFLPMAGKLRDMSAREVMYKEFMLEGILSIQAGENPRIIEEKLKAFIPADIKVRTNAKDNRTAREVEHSNA